MRTDLELIERTVRKKRFDIDIQHDVIGGESRNFAQKMLSIMSTWDILFGTIFRDISVYNSILNEEPSGVVRIGDAAADASFFFGCLALAGFIGLGAVYSRERDLKLQTKSDDYFIQKLLDLNNPERVKFFGKDIKDTLYYYGENVLAPVAWWRRLTSDLSWEELGQLKNKKKECVAKAVQDIYQTHNKKIRTRRLLFDRGRYQIMEEEDLRPEDKTNLQSGRTVIFQRLKENQGWKIFCKSDFQELTEEQCENLSSLLRLSHQLADFLKDNEEGSKIPFNLTREALKNNLKDLKRDHFKSTRADKTIKFLRNLAWETFQAAIFYMYGFWVTWYAVIAITGAGVAVGAGLGMLLLSFALPLVPLVLYLLGLLLFRDRLTQPKCLSKVEDNHAIFNAEYKAKLDQDLIALKASLGFKKDEKIKSIDSDYLKDLFKDLSKQQSLVEESIAALKLYGRILIPCAALSGMMTGMIITGFFSWPVVSFLVMVCGITAASSPIGLAVIFGLALFFGVCLSMKMLLERCQAQGQMLETLEQKQVQVSTLIQLEKENAILEAEIKKIKAQYDELKNAKHVEIVGVLPSISTQDRFFRRMSITGSDVSTYLKKGANRLYLAIQTAGTGILFPRIYLAPGSLFDVFTPVHFIFFASGMGIVWAIYKLAEYAIQHAYERHLAMLNDVDNRIDMEQQKKEFLIDELAVWKRAAQAANAQQCAASSSTVSVPQVAPSPLVASRETLKTRENRIRYYDKLPAPG